MRQPVRQALLLVALAAVYVVAGKIGLQYATVHRSASPVWPPTGIALAALLLYGVRLWPAVLLGALVVNVTTTGSLLTSAAIAVGNTLEAAVGAYLVGRFASGAAAFQQARDIFRFALLAAFAATAFSASFGVASLVLAGEAPWSDVGAIWLTWWLGNAAGALIVTPLLVLWYVESDPFGGHGHRIEALLLLASVAGVGYLLFVAPTLGRYPLTFLCLPLLAWAAFRFGPREVATAVAVLTATATAATVQGQAALGMAARNSALLVLQTFMATIALTALPIAALVREHRRAIAAAEAANRAKDEFLAMFSHELRNPLSAITNAAAVLERVQPAGHSAAGRALDVIRRQAANLTRLVNDLLDVTRLTHGRSLLVSQPVNVGETLQRSHAALVEAGKCGAHTLEIHADEVWARADPARLEQIVMNLLGNALKYTPAGGRIRAWVTSEDSGAVLRVQDDGIGISPQLLPRIFEPFTQGQRGLDRSAGGIGVGLTLVQRLVAQHGGTVEAASDGPGRGALFTVRLPRAERPQSAPAASGGAVAEPPRCRVLVIEDNRDASDSLCALLQLAGHEVHQAFDGETGIDQALALRPDVALIDIGLPAVDGYEVARRLRGRIAGLRLIALTGYGREDDRRRALAAGFDEHLVKPASADDLARTFRSVTPRPG